MEFKRTKEQEYLKTKDAIDALLKHLKSFRRELNSHADALLDGGEEYIFSTGDLVLKKPTTHKATKIRLN